MTSIFSPAIRNPLAWRHINQLVNLVRKITQPLGKRYALREAKTTRGYSCRVHQRGANIFIAPAVATMDTITMAMRSAVGSAQSLVCNSASRQSAR
jgi:hypothetical protein